MVGGVVQHRAGKSTGTKKAAPYGTAPIKKPKIFS